MPHWQRPAPAMSWLDGAQGCGPPRQGLQHSMWLHGDAADRFAARHPNQPLRATELIDWLANAD
jgi:hypothetical protein